MGNDVTGGIAYCRSSMSSFSFFIGDWTQNLKILFKLTNVLTTQITMHLGRCYSDFPKSIINIFGNRMVNKLYTLVRQHKRNVWVLANEKLCKWTSSQFSTKWTHWATLCICPVQIQSLQFVPNGDTENLILNCNTSNSVNMNWLPHKDLYISIHFLNFVYSDLWK